MKTSFTSFPDLYSTWMSTGLSMMLGNSPAEPIKEPTPKPASKPLIQSRARRAAPAKKKVASRKAKGAKRR